MTAPGPEVDADPVVVRLRDASVARNGRIVWEDSSFALAAGTVTAVIGPNGSGKTTLLQVLLGLLPLRSGHVEVLGRTPQRGEQRIGYVPQNYTAVAGGAVRAVDLVGLAVSGGRWGLPLARGEDKARVRHALEAVSATDLAGRRMSELSGGQQQRVAIARALVDDPQLLLLDEPLANLDVRNQREIVELLGDLNRRRHMTVLVVAHDLNPLLSVLSGVVYLLDGHAHYDAVDDVVNAELLSHLYGTSVKVVRTAQGDLFTRTG